MSKRLAYPIVLRKTGDGWYAVTIPDFDSHTQGKDLAEALYMARDAIGLMGITLQDDGEAVPEPYSKQYKTEVGDMEYAVDVDFEEYRSEHDSRSVRKNVTIPYYLNAKAEKMGINFSRVLQEALQERVRA